MTERARQVVFAAQEEAGAAGTTEVTPELLLLGMLRDRENVSSRLLTVMEVDIDALAASIGASLRRRTPPRTKEEKYQLTSAGRDVINQAYREAVGLSNDYIGTEHLLLGVIQTARGKTADILKMARVVYNATRISTIHLQQGGAVWPPPPTGPI